MGMGPVPWRAIRAWADEHGVTTPDAFDELLTVVQHLDGLWLKNAAARVKNSSKP